MTWIRWDTVTPRSEVIGFLAERLGVKPVQALGHYNAMACGFGDHRADGRLDKVSDPMLETWAMWAGKPGRFAKAMRDWCAMAVEVDGDPGELRGWWRQTALLTKQERDRQKPDGRKKSRANPPGDSGGIPRKSRDDPSRATNERTNETNEKPLAYSERDQLEGSRPWPISAPQA